MPQPLGAHDAALTEVPLDPDMPKSEMFFWQSSLWHSGHSTSVLADIERTNLSKVWPQARHRYSYMGIDLPLRLAGQLRDRCQYGITIHAPHLCQNGLAGLIEHDQGGHAAYGVRAGNLVAHA
jgi:hypothetical protein